ncbi:MAG: EamA family transporter [Rhodobacteraceae bacterium]|nr:EamA family transporter [Paracoccaceae bacterium]
MALDKGRAAITPAAVRNYRLGLALVTGSAVAWSTAGFFTRLIPLHSATLLVWRGLFGGLGLLALIIVREGRGTPAALTSMGRPGVIFAAVSALGMVFFITSLRHTTVAHVAVIYATVPFVGAALAWMFLAEAPGRAALLASLGALAGVTVMVGLGREGGLSGDLLAFGMTACMAAMMVISRRHPGIGVLPAAALSAWLSALAALPFADTALPGATDMVLLAAFGLVNSALGLAFFTLGARRLPVIETALIGALDAPLAPVWVFLAFGETPDRATLVGGLIVFAAVGLHLLVATGAGVEGPPPMAAAPRPVRVRRRR